MGWLKAALTGADNQTVAIGRLLAGMIAVVLLLAFPIIAVATVLWGICDVATWRQLFEALGIYVPMVVGAITGLVWGTSSTEPKPASRDNPDQR